MTAGTGSAGTNGFLFCDLRGYTAFIERHGDQAAADLLATYRSLVRATIASHAGAEIKTEGDSVYVVFPAASAAVEAGLEIVAAAAEASTKDAPIRVGVGVHAGETVATTEGLVGGAVNIAARVCAKAQAGEVLVTDTVRALTRTYLPYRYTSLGTQQLKGIAGGIPLYRVEAVPSSGAGRLRRQLGARRRRVLALTCLALVALVAATGVYALNRPADCLNLPASTKDVVARIDPTRNCVVAVYEVGQRPGSIVESNGSIWVGNVDDWTLSTIDMASGAVDTTGSGGSPISLAVDPAGDVYALIVDDRWVDATDGTVRHRVAKVDGESLRLFEIRKLPLLPAAYSGGYNSITYAIGRVWVSNQTAGQVVRVKFGSTEGGFVPITVGDPGSPAGSGPGPIGAGAGAIWVANIHEGLLHRLEGTTGTALEIALDGNVGSTTLAATEAAIWLGRQDGRLTRYDSVSGALTSFALPGSIHAIAASSGSVWVADGSGPIVREVNASTGQILATINVGGAPRGITVSRDGAVYVTLSDR